MTSPLEVRMNAVPLLSGAGTGEWRIPRRFVIKVTGAASSLATVVAWSLALMAAPQSGPWCREAVCVGYPYTDVEYRPIDFVWMYPAMLALVGFALLLVLVESEVTRRPMAARLARMTGVTGVTLLVVTYALQLMVVQPSVIRGEQTGLSFWTQYNPHGGFIALENVGYLLLSCALVALAWTVPGPGAVRRAARLASGVLGGLGVLLLPLMAALLGRDLEYLYEVTGISLVWLAIIVVAPLLGHAVGPGGEPVPPAGVSGSGSLPDGLGVRRSGKGRSDEQ